MALSSEDFAEHGPPPPRAGLVRNETGQDLLFERVDLGEGCHTLVPAGALIPEPLRGLPCRLRATGEPAELVTEPAKKKGKAG